ncbi:MAG: HD domain-containing protein [Campylobacterota bacterium]|nr:HD domain-containing protein [Campylobacterota bacterium]
MINLNTQIEELIEQKAPDFQIAKIIKAEIKVYLSSLDDIFNHSSGKDFFVKHTKKVDAFVKIIYKYLLRKHFHSYLPMSNSIPLTIIALGSYGREQLCVYSDIDIMVLYDDVSGYNLKPIMEEFMTLAWDSGLKLGSRVHELKEVQSSVKTDITIKTSILESRLICGSKHLWFKYQNKLSKIRNYNQKEFILDKIEEHQKRLKKFPLNMQPNIKDGYGGMRDSNMLFWIANITFGVSTSKELVGKIFTDDEYKIYRTSLEYIFKVRNALHLLSKKKLDIVTFDILPDLSSKLGFQNTIRLTKERQCSAKIFQSLHKIHNFTTIMFKKISRYHLYDLSNISDIKKHRFSKNIYIYENKVYTSFSAKPKKINLLLKELISLPNDVSHFDSSYLYYVSKTTSLTKTNQSTKNLILSLLQKENLYPIIKLLYDSNLLLEVIPSFKKLINQPQFDGYHKHPVDIHSIQTLYHIQNIKDPFLQNMYNRLSSNQKFVLNITALLHDCGKGRTKDHHIVGLHLFKKFAISLNINDNTIALASKLIRYHNMMAKFATTEDIYSQKTILSFAGIIPNKETLELLFLLTYADINSVDSKLYKSSTQALLKELYLQTLPAYENTELLNLSSRRVAKENAIRKNKLFIQSSRLLQKKLLNINSNQLFLKYKAEDIIKIAIRAKDITKWDYKISNENNLKIKITRAVPLNLGYLLGKLDFLNISSMGIYKLFDEKKFFQIAFDEKVDAEDIPYIEQSINESFDMTKDFKTKKPIINKNNISINCDHTDELAKMNIISKDQKGLFSYISKVFDDFNIEIHSAKIQSHNGKVNDMLLISKNGNFCSNKDRIINILSDS